MKEPAMIGNLPYDDNDPTLKTLRPFIKNAPAKGKINALNDLLRVALMINSIEPDLIDKLNMLIKLRDKGTLIENEFLTIFTRSLLENIDEPSKLTHQQTIAEHKTPSVAPREVSLSHNDDDLHIAKAPVTEAPVEPESACNDELMENIYSQEPISAEFGVSSLDQNILSPSIELQQTAHSNSLQSDDITLDNMVKLSGAWGEDNS